MLATQAIQLGNREKCLVVGTESMSQAPYYLPRAGLTYGDVLTVVRCILNLGLLSKFGIVIS